MLLATSDALKRFSRGDRVADPVGFYPNPDPTFEKKLDPDPTKEKIWDPDQLLFFSIDINVNIIDTVILFQTFCQ